MSTKDSRTKDTIVSIFIGVLFSFLASMYVYGGYKLFTDKEYDAKNMVAGFIVPPYTIYIGIYELFDDEPIKKKRKILTDAEKMSRSFDSSIKRRLNN